MKLHIFTFRNCSMYYRREVIRHKCQMTMQINGNQLRAKCIYICLYRYWYMYITVYSCAEWNLWHKQAGTHIHKHKYIHVCVCVWPIYTLPDLLHTPILHILLEPTTSPDAGTSPLAQESHPQVSALPGLAYASSSGQLLHSHEAGDARRNVTLLDPRISFPFRALARFVHSCIYIHA